MTYIVRLGQFHIFILILYSIGPPLSSNPASATGVKENQIQTSTLFIEGKSCLQISYYFSNIK